MSAGDLDRIKQDIEAIREAAGLELPFGREDVFINLALVPYAAYSALISALAPSRYFLPLFLIPTAGLMLSVVALRFRYRMSTGRSPVRRREYSLNLVMGAIYGALIGGYLFWVKGRGEPITLALGFAIAMGGGICAILAMTGRGRQFYLAPAVTMLGLGLVIPFCSPLGVGTAAFVALASNGLLSAAIMTRQLRSQGGGHGPTTD